jgi:acetyl esterase/lipase
VLRQLLRLEPPRHAPAGHTAAGRTRGPRRPAALTPAADENEIPTDDAIEFAERARAVGVDVELRSVPDGQHIFCLRPAGFAWSGA